MYFPIGQAALKILPAVGGGENSLAVSVQTMTPNFASFRYRIDGGKWQDLAPVGPAKPAGVADPKGAWRGVGAPADVAYASMLWTIHGGQNTLEAQAVNKSGVEGATSKVVLEAVKK